MVAANRIEAANAWTAAVAADPEALAAYQGQVGIAAGIAYLSGITADRSTIPTVTQLDAAIVTLIGEDEQTDPDPVPDPEPEPEPGQTFTLTEESGETAIGTGGNDTFNAILGSDHATLNADDSIDGNGGTDTLNLVVAARVAIPDTASIENVEIINLDQSAAVVLDLTAASFEGATHIWQINNATSISGLESGQTAGFRDTGDVSTELRFTGDTGNIALQLGATGGAAAFKVHGTDLTSLNISGSMDYEGGDKYAPLEITDALTGGNASLTNLTEINISMSTDTEIYIIDLLNGGDYNSLVAFNATGSTGGIALFLDAESYFETISFGSGSDMLYIDTDYFGGGDGGVPVEINMGAGDDFVIAWLYDDGNANVGLNITFGAGFDTFAVYGGFENIRDSEAKFMDGIVSIFGFNASEDVIVMDGSVVDTGFFTPNSFRATLKILSDDERGQVESATTLFAALERAAEFANGDVVTFKFQDSTYIFNDSQNVGEFGNGDGLIELVGFTGALSLGENFLLGWS